MKTLMRSPKFSTMVFAVLLVTSLASAQQIGEEVTCYKASSPPKIDGKLNDWDAKASITGVLTPDSDSVGPYRNDPLPADEDDCSFEAFAMWDEDNFYIAFAVDDDPIVENAAGAPWDAPDYVEIYTDPTNKSNADRGDGWCIGPRNGDDTVAFQSDPIERDAPDHDIVIAASDGPLRDGKGGWVIELRLGKDSFDPEPLALKPDSIMGMIIFVNDTDEGESRSRMVVPGGGDTSGIPTSDSFLLVLSAEIAAVSPIGNSATTWGQIKAAD
jgi:hypothetical protein